MGQTTETTLSKLIVQAQAGQKDAYREFLRLLYPYIEKKLSRKVFDKDDLHDVTQEVILSIHKSLATYDPKYPIGAWLHTICQRRLVDYIRKISKIAENITSEEYDVTNHIGAANIYSEREHYELLDELSPSYKEVIILTKVQGFSTAEAAEKLGIKENALRTRLSRAFRELEKILKSNL